MQVRPAPKISSTKPGTTVETETAKTAETAKAAKASKVSKAGETDVVDPAVVTDTPSSRRTSGAGLTSKLVDPKRAVATEKTVGELLAFTPEELAYARSNPVVIGADHNGAPLAAKLAAFLKQMGIPVTDVASPMAAAAKGEKYPYAQAALPALVGLTNKSAARAILICGNGIGMRDVAKQWPGAKVSYGEIQHEVRSSRKAEDSNVLALGARLFGEDADLAKLFVKTFLATPYQGMPERYAEQTEQVQAWAKLALEKGGELKLEDFGQSVPDGAVSLTTLRLQKKD